MRFPLNSLPLLLTMCAGCASSLVSTADVVEQMSQTIHERTGQNLVWRQEGTAGLETRARLESLLREDFSEDKALAVALLNSSRLQAQIERLAVLHGDQVNRLAIKNPLLTVLARAPEQWVVFSEVNFLQSLVEIILRPWKQEQATIDLQRERLEISQIILDTVRDVRVAYHQMRASEQVASLRRVMLDDVQKASELAEFRSKSRQINDSRVALARATYQQLRLDVARAELDSLMKREALTQLLGLPRPPSKWAVMPLPVIPQDEASMEYLEKLALKTRVDIASAEARVQLMTKALNLTRSSAFVGTVLVGAAANRDGSGVVQYGPTLVLELPIFNRRQGQIEQLEAALRIAEQEAQQLRVGVVSQVRLAYGALAATREIANSLADAVMPLRRRITELSAQEADDEGKSVSAWDVVLARQTELQAQCERAEMTHAYWEHRARLEHAVGTNLVVGSLQMTGPQRATREMTE